jgi:uncharacterized protein
MTKDFWINLPVKNAGKSKAFFSALGFKFNPNYHDNHSASMFLGQKNVVVMLFEDQQFQGFTGQPPADVTKGTEVLLSFDAESKEEVDNLIVKVIEAGGSSSHRPYEMSGWMYGCVFTDLDGHKWNVLHMDMSKMNQG